ncbi:MAG: hypothetical protein ACOH1T_06025 [Microbacteriaceae bacterium]
MSPGRRILSSVVVVLALVVSGFAVATAPDNDAVTGPIATTATVGEKAATPEFETELHGVRLADTLDVSYGANDFSFPITELPSDGVWVVADLTLTSRFDTVLLQNSEIRIAGVSYRTSALLPLPTVSSSRFGPGLPVRGPIVFELPRSVVESDAARFAVIEFKTKLTPQLEGVTTYPVDLTSLNHDKTAVLGGASIAEGF